MSPRYVVIGCCALLLGASCSTDASDTSDPTDPSTEPTRSEADEDPTTTGPSDDAALASTTSPPTSTASAAPAGPADFEPPAEATMEFMAIGAGAHAPMTAELSVTFDVPTQLEVTATSGDHVVEVPRTADAAVDHVVPIVGMRAGRTYDISIVALTEGTRADLTGADPHMTFDVPSLPDWLPDHRVTVADADLVSSGITLVETQPAGDDDELPSGVLVGYDADGEVVWYYANEGGIGAVEQTADGTFVGNYAPFGVREFDVLGDVVGNWQPEVPRGYGVAALESPPAGNEGDPEPQTVVADWIELRSFHHENWPLPNGNILALSTTLHDLSPDQREALCPGDPHEFQAVSDVVVEFTPDGTVLRTWDMWDAIDVVEHPGSSMCVAEGLFSSEEARDWTHANAVVYDPDRDAILVSVRHTDQVIAFDYGNEPGPQTDVRWILGAAATMPFDGEPTYHQHAVEILDDSQIILYDNGNDRPGTTADDPDNAPFSRAVIYRVDDASDDRAEWSAEQVWEHTMVDQGVPVYAAFLGDADLLANGNALITHGAIAATPPAPEAEPEFRTLVFEVTPDGEVVWRLDSDPSGSHTTYRAERIDSFYVGDRWEPRN